MGEGYEGIPLEDLRFESVDWTYRAEHVASRSSARAGTSSMSSPAGPRRQS